MWLHAIVRSKPEECGRIRSETMERDRETKERNLSSDPSEILEM